MTRWLAAFAFAAVCAVRASADVPDVGWTQRIGAILPLQLTVVDETGQRVQLQDYFHDVPAIIVFAYLSCTRLCPETVASVGETLRATGLSAGRDYVPLIISIDPNDTPALAAERKAHVLGDPSFRRSVHILTSPDGAVSQLAEAAGFRYLRVGEQTQFAHPAGFLVATPQGTISHYFFGVRYPAVKTRAALLAARDNRTGGFAERLLLLCYGLDPAHGARSAAILNALRALAVLGLILAGVLGRRFLDGNGRPQ